MFNLLEYSNIVNDPHFDPPALHNPSKVAQDTDCIWSHSNPDYVKFPRIGYKKSYNHRGLHMKHLSTQALQGPILRENR